MTIEQAAGSILVGVGLSVARKPLTALVLWGVPRVIAAWLDWWEGDE